MTLTGRAFRTTLAANRLDVRAVLAANTTTGSMLATNTTLSSQSDIVQPIANVQPAFTGVLGFEQLCQLSETLETSAILSITITNCGCKYNNANNKNMGNHVYNSNLDSRFTWENGENVALFWCFVCFNEETDIKPAGWVELNGRSEHCAHAQRPNCALSSPSRLAFCYSRNRSVGSCARKKYIGNSPYSCRRWQDEPRVQSL